jgi:hypothetical protein
MNTKDFVLNSINLIVDQFPFIQCTYQYDKFTCLHSIEILPNTYLNSPNGFGAIQYEITKNFMKNFPGERLSFFTTTNSIKIEKENIVSIIKGRMFELSKEVNLFPEHVLNIPDLGFILDKDNNYALAA